MKGHITGVEGPQAVAQSGRFDILPETRELCVREIEALLVAPGKVGMSAEGLTVGPVALARALREAGGAYADWYSSQTSTTKRWVIERVASRGQVVDNDQPHYPLSTYLDIPPAFANFYRAWVESDERPINPYTGVRMTDRSYNGKFGRHPGHPHPCMLTQ